MFLNPNVSKIMDVQQHLAEGDLCAYSGPMGRELASAAAGRVAERLGTEVQASSTSMERLYYPVLKIGNQRFVLICQTNTDNLREDVGILVEERWSWNPRVQELPRG